MFSFIKKKNKLFYTELLSSKVFLIVLLLYVILKIVSNIYYGASYFTAFRSGIIGLLLYLLGFYIINIFSSDTDKSKQIFKIDHKVAKSGLIASSVYFIFLFIQIIDNLQRQDIINGYPVLSYLPGYNWLISVINNISNSVAGTADFISPIQIEKIIEGNLFYLIIPLILFKLLGYSFRGLFSLKNTRASWPFLVMYIIMFIINGINIKRLWGFLYTVLYPGLSEEFFHRGIVFRTTASIFNKTPIALIVGTVFFSLMHFSSYYFTIYDGNLLMTFSNMSDVFITGMFWAYGFRKTGTLIPWIIIHAFSNIPYLF